MNIYLLYNQFYSSDGKNRRIGGIETYIENLAYLLHTEGNKIVICQYADKPFNIQLEYASVQGFMVNSMEKLYKSIEFNIDKRNDIIIFMSDVLSLKIKGIKCLSIQHGISWDKPYFSGYEFINKVKRLKAIIKALYDFNKCKYSVCVDYNFYNWYKTFIVKKQLPKKIWIIPNFSSQILPVTSRLSFDSQKIKIIFARRFEEYRGSLLFVQVVKQIMIKYTNVYVTIAGEGPCEVDMKHFLQNFHDRVHFTKYLPKESFEIHKSHDIAVVPTIGSEGTSLSLLEAMGAGCIPICTPVGGMSNIILDGYNGLVAMPNEKSLYAKINEAILLTEQEALQMKKNALLTVAKSFSIEKWGKSWMQVITEIENDKN